MSGWHAVAALEESVDRTKKLLFRPFNLVFWLKLALIVLLVNGISGGNSDRIVKSAGGGTSEPGVIVLAVVIVALFIILGIFFTYISSLFKFVYVKTLLEGRVRMVEDLKEQADNGLKLFLFTFAVVILLVAAIICAAVPLILLGGTLKSPFVMLFLIILGVILFVIILLAVSILLWLMDEFVVPVMYAEGVGVIGGLKRVYKMIQSDFWQFAVYFILKFSLGLVAAVLVFAISFMFFIAVFGVALLAGVGVMLGLSLAGSGTLESLTLPIVVVGVVVMMILTIAVSYVVTAITLPLSVFFRYYGLVFLQLAQPQLNLFKTSKKNNGERVDGEGKVKVY
jgi:hypothetical protein